MYIYTSDPSVQQSVHLSVSMLIRWRAQRGNRSGEQLWLSVLRLWIFATSGHSLTVTLVPSQKRFFLFFFHYINKVPCFAPWASSTHSKKIYMSCPLDENQINVIILHTFGSNGGAFPRSIHSEAVRIGEGVEKTLYTRVCVS